MLKSGVSPGDVSRNLQIPARTLSNWKKSAKEAGTWDGAGASQAEVWSWFWQPQLQSYGCYQEKDEEEALKRPFPDSCWPPEGNSRSGMSPRRPSVMLSTRCWRCQADVLPRRPSSLRLRRREGWTGPRSTRAGPEPSGPRSCGQMRPTLSCGRAPRWAEESVSRPPSPSITQTSSWGLWSILPSWWS